jgi:hypothetical protein
MLSAVHQMALLNDALLEVVRIDPQDAKVKATKSGPSRRDRKR